MGRKTVTSSKSLNKAIKIFLLYLILGTAWIFVTDLLLVTYIGDSVNITRYQTVKGAFFIIVSGLYFSYLIYKNLSDVFKKDTRLEKTLEQFQALIRHSPLPIMFTDREGKVKTWNKAAENLTGYSKEEVLNRIPPLIPENRVHEYRKFLKRLEKGGEINGEVMERTGKQGKPLQLQLFASAIRDKNGKLTGFVSFIRDITEIKKKEEEKEKLKARLHQSQKMEALGRVTGGIAHDFNNILSIIHGNANLMLEGIEDSSKKEYLKTIISAAERGTKLTSNLLTFSKRKPLKKRIFGFK